MAASMEPQLTITNVRDSTTLVPGFSLPVVSTTRILSISIHRDQKGTEEIEVDIAMGDNGAVAIETATTSGAAIPVRCELSLCVNHPSSTDVRYVDGRFMLETPIYTIDLSGKGGSRIAMAQKGLFRGYAMTLIDRLTTHQVPLSALIDGPASLSTPGLGYYMRQAGNAGIGTPPLLSAITGYGQTTPGLSWWALQSSLRFGFYIDASIGPFLVDSDEDSSPIDMAILAAIEVAAGSGDGGQELGLHGHWVSDSSDALAGNQASAALGIPGPSINIGGIFDSGLTFTLDPTLVGNGAYGQHGFDAYAPILSTTPVQKERHMEDINAVLKIEGGTSSHGLPPGAMITGMVVVNLQTSPTSDWDANLLVIGCKTATGDGGVFYYHTDSRIFYACSPAMAVTSLWYDAAGNAMYAATEQGCFRKQGFWVTLVPPVITGWSVIGGNTMSTPPRAGFNAKSLKVQARGITCSTAYAAGGAKTNIFALADGTSQDRVHGLFVHPTILNTALSTSAETLAIAGGFDGWQAIDPTPGIVDFNYIGMNGSTLVDELHYVHAAKAWQLIFRTGLTTGTAPTVASVRYVSTPNNSAILGLDPGIHGTVVRTTAGSAGLYLYIPGVVDGSGHPLMVNMVAPAILSGGVVISGLVDPNNNAVMVNRVYAYAPPLGTAGTIGGEYVTYLAATDSGIYWTTTDDTTIVGSGATWYALNGQSGLLDQNIVHVVAGYPQYLLDSSVSASRVWASTGAALYTSNCDGLYFDDDLSAPVDVAAYWLYLAAQVDNGGVQPYFPPNNVVGYAWAGYSGMPWYDTNTYGTAGYVGAPGAVHVIVTTGQPYSLPAGYVFVAALNKHNARSYRLLNMLSDSPYAATLGGEIAEIVADPGTGIGAAATRLSGVTIKKMNDSSMMQEILTFASSFATPTHLLRKLRPMMNVTVNVNVPSLQFVYSFAEFYVLDHIISWSQGQKEYQTMTTLGRLLRDTPPTFEEIAQQVGYRESRTRKYIRLRLR